MIFLAIDGYFLSAQIREFKDILVNSKLRKINGESVNSLSLEFFISGKNYYLLFDISPNKAHMRLINEPKGRENFNFINVLKKEIINSTLIEIKQYKKDRIILFEFLKNDPFFGQIKKILVFEVMGRNSNLILIDNNFLILDSFKKIFNEDKRSILPNIKYEFYPTIKKLYTEEKLKIINSPSELFYNYMGFSKEFAEFIYNNKLNPDNLKTNPTLYKGKKISFHAYDLLLKGEKITFTDTSALLKYYYELTTKSDDFLIKLLLKQKKRLTQKINNLNTELLKNNDYQKYKTIADEIYQSSLNLNKRYETFNSFQLDSKLTLNKNAQKLYQKYKRLKNSLDFLNKEIKQTKEELLFFEDLIASYNIFNKNDLDDLKLELKNLGLIKEKKQKETFKPKYQTYDLENATCIVGKTAKQNEEIFSRFAKGEDLWFHVQDYPGAHVILKGEKTEENITFAAKKALINSPLKSSQKGYVNYTKVKFVKRITKRIGFYVTYKNSTTIFITL